VRCFVTPSWNYVKLCVTSPTQAPREVLVTRHFGHKTLRHQDTLGHFGTNLKTLRHQKRGTRDFDMSAVIEEKLGHFDPGQLRWDAAPPVIRLKLRYQFCDAEVSRCRSVLWPKCLAPEVLPVSTPVRLLAWWDLLDFCIMYCSRRVFFGSQLRLLGCF